MAQQIAIRGKEFQVETGNNDRNGQISYTLTGKRGAKYGTMRNRAQPNFMFIINLRGFGMAPGYDGVWLTDANGQLEIAEVTWSR